MVKIMTDMSADITKEQAEKYDIKVLPFYINFGEESILADIDYTPEMFYEKFKSLENIPSTSQATPDILEEMYRSIGKENQIIHITIPANSSGIVNTARMISSQLSEEGFDITIIDSSMFSYGIGANVVAAAEMAENGVTKDEIVGFLQERFEKDRVYFIVDDLTTLKKGGRIKATTMVVSAVLDIKPILYSNEGKVEAFAKVKGMKRAIAKLVDCIEENIEDPENTEICIMNADCPEKAEMLKKAIEERLATKNIWQGAVGPIITCHAGVGVFGTYFRHK
ncbi:MAG: DegV family protein [Ruminococcaceae bacterium]|nr:DegV family protein [Oscillospiraceae bacterium]